MFPQGETAEWESGDGIPSCFVWSEGEDRWTGDGIGVDAVSVGGTGGAANVTCRTYHLSTFASSETQGISMEFVLDGFLADFEVLQEVCNAMLHSSGEHTKLLRIAGGVHMRFYTITNSVDGKTLRRPLHL